MQASRRNQFTAEQLSVIVRRNAVDTRHDFGRASVTALDDYIHRHGCGDFDEAPPTARKGEPEVCVIAQDQHDSPLAPRRNLLLAALDASAYADLRPHLELVALPQGWVVCEAGGDMDYVYFPTSGIVSLLCELESGASIEVALTGKDGLVGVHVLMGGGAATTRAVVRNTGHGWRIRVNALMERFDRCPPLRRLLLRYAQALIAQTTQTAACHCHHQLEQQMSRLLLLTLDRLSSNEVAMTQDAMAGLLGVRRESITVTAGKLQDAGLIRYHRGRIAVTNRPRLEACACECYTAVNTELDRLLPQRSYVAHKSERNSRRVPPDAILPARVPFGRAARTARPDREPSPRV